MPADDAAEAAAHDSFMQAVREDRAEHWRPPTATTPPEPRVVTLGEALASSRTGRAVLRVITGGRR